MGGDGDAGAVGFFVMGGDGGTGAVGFFVMGGGFFIKVAASLQWGIWRDTLHFFEYRCVCLSPST